MTSLVQVVMPLVLLAGPPAGPGKPIEKEGLRVTLVAVDLLAPELRKGAEGGVRVVWLVELPSDGEPALGDVRLVVGGAQYNVVSNATSSKPLAPDIIVDDPDVYFKRHPSEGQAAKPPTGRVSIVAQVLLRGATLKKVPDGVVGIELGVVIPKPGRPPKPTYQWFEANTRN